MIINPLEQPNSQDEIRVDDDAKFTQSTATKSVILLCQLLRRQKLSFEPGLEMFIQIFLHPVILVLGGNHFSQLLEQRTIECLSLFCSLSRPLAEEYFTTFCNVAINDPNSDQTYSGYLQNVAVKAITDMALVYHGEMELNETSNETTSDTQASQIEKSKEIHERVAEVLLDIWKKNQRRLYADVDVESTDETLEYVIIKSVCRLLFRGECNAKLFAASTIFVMQDSDNSSEIRKVRFFVDFVVQVFRIKCSRIFIDLCRKTMS